MAWPSSSPCWSRAASFSVWPQALKEEERAKSEDLLGELRHQAFHDNLTGVANRALFSERLEHALARRRPLSANHAILMVDLNGFKSVNDSLGHEAGNELLGRSLLAFVMRCDEETRWRGSAGTSSPFSSRT